jgi:hypothetical protein
LTQFWLPPPKLAYKKRDFGRGWTRIDCAIHAR